jgi:hypothetical protein
MTFKGVCKDGDDELVVEFEDRNKFLIWQQSMTAIKEEAGRIVAENENAENLTKEDVNAVRNWIRRVTEMVEANTPVLPSVLRAKDTFAEAINERS